MEIEVKTCKVCGRELPATMFKKTGIGQSCVCKDCEQEKRRQTELKKREIEQLKSQLNAAVHKRLETFTPRELMEELKRRGYDGHLTYTHVETIDLSKL